MNYQDIVKLAEEAGGETLDTAEEVINEAVYNSIVTGSYMDELEKIAERGQGLGVGGAPQGDLGADKCKCPDCGHTMAHVKGTPCQDVACPKCGTKMKGVTVKTAEDMEKLSEAEILSAMTYDAIVEAAYADEMEKIAVSYKVLRQGAKGIGKAVGTAGGVAAGVGSAAGQAGASVGKAFGTAGKLTIGKLKAIISKSKIVAGKNIRRVKAFPGTATGKAKPYINRYGLPSAIGAGGLGVGTAGGYYFGRSKRKEKKAEDLTISIANFLEKQEKGE